MKPEALGLYERSTFGEAATDDGEEPATPPPLSIFVSAKYTTAPAAMVTPSEAVRVMALNCAQSAISVEFRGRQTPPITAEASPMRPSEATSEVVSEAFRKLPHGEIEHGEIQRQTDSRAPRERGVVPLQHEDREGIAAAVKAITASEVYIGMKRLPMV